jgi:4-carboxymuconolactone decarboxylase
MSLCDPIERTRVGLAVQAEVTATRVSEPRSLWGESWRDYIFAEIWTRPGLERRARYLISMATAACSSGPTDALDNYVRGALANAELSLGELREAALHLSVYAGWSRGGALDRAVDGAVTALNLDPVELPPIRAAAWDPQLRIAEGIAEFENVMTFPGPPPVTPYFEAGIDNFVFGEMWKRPGLDQRSRRWITLVGVCESGADTPIQSHIHAAMASGNCTPPELHEFVLQYAVHAGWPRASHIQAAVFAMEKKIAAGLPYNG